MRGRSAHALDWDACLVGAPVEALAGVSQGDAELLARAFGIRTIGDLATNKYFVAARQIADIASR